MPLYLANQLLRWSEDNRLERVLWVDHPSNVLYVIDVSAKTALPRLWDCGYLDVAESEGRVVFEPNDATARIVSEDSLSSKQKEQRDFSWKILRPLLENQPAIFDAKQRGTLINQAVKEHGITKQTIYRLLRRYWQRGMTLNALLSDYYRSGAIGVEKSANSKKRGRPRVYGEASGMNVDAEARQRIKTIVLTEYAKKRSKMDMATAYRELLDRYYSVSEISEKTGQQRIVRLMKCPSMRQFRYWAERDNDMFKIERIRRTPRVYDKDMRSLLNTSSSEVIGPGSRYQIDATIADVYLVSRFDKTKIVGRPVIYVLVDVFSRMIVGIHAGFEGPSWVGAMMALANTATDKVEFCKQYGIEIEPSYWPCKVLPEVLLSDRGETAGKSIETLIEQFHIHLETAAPYRADWKGIVEQKFRLLQANFSPYVPGYVQTDYRERGSSDYRLDATLDIDQFTYIIIHNILAYNNAHVLNNYHRDPDMVADNVKTVPADLWEWGIQRRSGRAHYYSPDLVKFSLLPSDEATVTESGIRFYGCFYICSKAQGEHWFERARQYGYWKVRISYDPRVMDSIYLHDDQGNFVSCDLMDRSRDYRGMSLWEIDQINFLNRKLSVDLQPTETVAKINLSRAVKAKIAEAEAMKRSLPSLPSSKKARTANIRTNRAHEKESLRGRDAFTPPQNGKKAEVLSINRSESIDDDFEISDVTPGLLNFDRENQHDKS